MVTSYCRADAGVAWYGFRRWNTSDASAIRRRLMGHLCSTRDGFFASPASTRLEGAAVGRRRPSVPPLYDRRCALQPGRIQTSAAEPVMPVCHTRRERGAAWTRTLGSSTVTSRLGTGRVTSADPSVPGAGGRRVELQLVEAPAGDSVSGPSMTSVPAERVERRVTSCSLETFGLGRELRHGRRLGLDLSRIDPLA